ncbi:lytic transglycosylase domain-containing protein [Mariprofundus erugo]|uniref:lytic transglycosylase domain-containing protein n=1 Tax=Mariprofundus erugo TaxID=2528639 RepID=UPI001EE7E860|nr:lytic transglycosylase domain-containing protein [Mariprofundus erugo]
MLLSLLNGCSLLHTDIPSLFSHHTATDHEQAAAVPAAPATPLLAGLSAEELSAVKAEALRAYQPRWPGIAKRSRYVRQTVLEALSQADAPLELQLIPAVESGYDPYAQSDVGATGLWQLMPETAADLHIVSNHQFDGRRDVSRSTHGAAQFLKKQHQRFGSWPLALAAYHLGPNAVQRRLQRRPWHDGDGLKRLPLPPVTKTYIRHILGLIALQQEGRINFPAPYPTETIEVQTPVDLERLHTVVALPKNQLFLLNPKLGKMQYFQNSPATISLRISQKRIDRLRQAMVQDSADHLTIRVGQGETIRDISRHYQVSVNELKRTNPNMNRDIKPGMVLQIPLRALTRIKVSDNPLLTRTSTGTEQQDEMPILQAYND